MTLADLKKPQVGIGTVWYESNPCNMHLLDLAAAVKEGVQGEGLVGLRFSTVGVSDGISMGTAGMAYSLPSRDLIADSFETVRPSAPAAAWTQSTEPAPTRAAACRAHADRGRALLRRHCRAAWLRQEHAGLRPGHVAFEPVRPGGVKGVAFVHADLTVWAPRPCRARRPALMVYGGTIRAGRSCRGEPLNVMSAFEAYGAYANGKMSEAERLDIVQHACPGPGACGGMYTANTSARAFDARGGRHAGLTRPATVRVRARASVAAAIEALGLTLPYSSCTPATDPAKRQEWWGVGGASSAVVSAAADLTGVCSSSLGPLTASRPAAPSGACWSSTSGRRTSSPARRSRTRSPQSWPWEARRGGEGAQASPKGTLNVHPSLPPSDAPRAGSTNAVLHLIAMGRAAGVPVALSDFQSISDKVPYLADLKPRYGHEYSSTNNAPCATNNA